MADGDVRSPAEAIVRLEACEIDNRDFRHRQHVEMAWNYLQLYPLAEAIGRFAKALTAFAAHNGHPELYHETITWAYMILVNERLQDSREASFDAFAAQNPDLLVWPNGVLDRYYTPETLASERAKTVFVMPDRTT